MISKELALLYKEGVLFDLASKIKIVGSKPALGQQVHIELREGANMTNVASLLKKYFGIEYRLKYCKFTHRNVKWAPEKEILDLCKYFIEAGVQLKYENKWDGTGDRPTIEKQAVRNGSLELERLAI